MIAFVACALAVALFAIAALHAAWGFGSTWPDADGATLARRVAGFKGVARMPPPPSCFMVAGALFAAGVVALGGGRLIPTPAPFALTVLALLCLSAIFGFRGVLAYVPRWREMTPEEPFARLDRTLYGPICIALAAGFFALARHNFLSVQ